MSRRVASRLGTARFARWCRLAAAARTTEAAYVRPAKVLALEGRVARTVRGTRRCWPGWITEVTRRWLALSTVACLTPRRAATWLMVSPSRTVYVVQRAARARAATA